MKTFLKCSLGRIVAGSLLAFTLIMVGTPAAQAVDFGKEIWPIVEERCVQCHGPKKQKGELNLSTIEGFQVGGENGPAIEPGDPEGSFFYTLTTLDEDHEDIMPAKGDPLTKEQTDLIKQWITDGADFGDFVPPEIKEEEGVEDSLTLLAKNVQPASADAMAAFADAGVLALPLDQKSPLVRVDYHLKGKEIKDEALAKLDGVAQQVTWLHLGGTAVTEGGLAKLASLPNLTQLHLEKTEIGDGAIAHIATLKHLEYLNLYGTKVTDAGIAKLSSLPKLKKLYVWQTAVTDDGVAALQALLPEAKINNGAALTEPEPTEEEKAAAEKLAAQFDKDSCCDKAHAEGKACDHACCVEAAAKGEVCLKCNPGAAPAPAADEAKSLMALFDKDGCCFKACADGKVCDHPCCVEAAEKGDVCAKCNPEGAAKQTADKLAAQFDKDSCCGKAHAEDKTCDHPCCVEAAAKGEICAKCNPEGAAKQASEKLATLFDKDSCCDKTHAEGKTCDHPCCVEAAGKGEVCAKCNPGAAASQKEA